MDHVIRKHKTKPRHYYVDGVLVAGAGSKAEALQIYLESQSVSEP